MVGLDGVEPSTSRLSGVRSNQTELQALWLLQAFSFKEQSLLDRSKLNSDASHSKNSFFP